MNAKGFRRMVLAAVALLGLAVAVGAVAQGMFYQEVAQDGRIYVFSDGQRFEAWSRSGEMGQAITRLGFGPNGETVVFDGENAINYYNFKHGLPGEVFPKPAEKPKPEYPKGKVIGLAFGDFYYFGDHHDAKFDKQQGFWLRRAYLGYDHSFTADLSARLRLEMNSNGKLAGGNLEPFVKDAYLTWKYHGKHQVRFGIQPSLTFDSEEGFWGLRHIEKTPADLYRVDSSRDFALTLSGPVGDSGFSYNGQFGNESGNGSETDKFKIVRLLGLYEAKSGLRVEGAFNYGARANDQDRTTAKGLLGYKAKQFRLSGEYLWQKRKSGSTTTPDTKIEIISAFGVWDLKPKKDTLFARFDKVKAKLGGAEAGLPGADGIDYLVPSTKSPFKTFIFGYERYINGSVRLSPNVEIVSYDDSAITKDFVARLTIYWTW